MKKLFLLLTIALTCKSLYAQTIIGLTADDKIFQITQASAPGTITTPISVSGLTPGQKLVGIDYRPNTGELYALGYNATITSGNARLYVINKSTAVATPIGAAAIDLDLGTGSVSVDFNPTVDRIRVMGANGKNYRLHPVTGAIAASDGNLAYATGDVNNAALAKIGACAYLNSYIGSEATTLFDYDQNLNIIVTQVPPNNGTLNTIGSTGITVNLANPSIGMDIYFDPVLKTNVAYLNANTGTSDNDNLYTINLATGATTALGLIGSGLNVKEIAVEINRTVPQNYTGQLVYGLTTTNRNLIKFSTGNPELIRELLPISGVTTGQVIVGMDVRPLNLGLYALGYNSTTQEYQVYNINTTTGAATAINATAGTIRLGVGEKISFDFNPTVDRIRVVSTNDSNYRLNPITGAVAATDTSLAYSASDVNNGKNPYIGSVAYTNSYKGTTTTALYGIDDSLQNFVQIVPPNQGVLNTLAANILPFNLADLTNDIDYFYDSVSMSNKGYLCANTGSSMNDKLYTIGTNGTAVLINDIGYGIPVSDIAVQLTFTNSAPTGIWELAKQSLFSIYPNPVADNLNISLYKIADKHTTLVVTDVTGKVIKTYPVAKGSTGLCLNLSDLNSGLYLINLSDQNAQAVRFFKN
ncbi:hypothetical protein DBR32_10980 [Taibaiella sp. KBW10]|uniref:DUF4394 domain-containing protein n=1 Tax=Taibaiella sp. KBW10 TaxID=2153357 RepID=UPI000F590CC4|nr:DUF4394 domain-containing protein [Taibaiella sp. KBW10]RQO30102.1 hypothetical protein DBR32_10980 [Taibaiella sp. KBW10]